MYETEITLHSIWKISADPRGLTYSYTDPKRGTDHNIEMRYVERDGLYTQTSSNNTVLMTLK